MKTNALYWLRRSLAVVGAAALLTGCVEGTPLGPNGGPAAPAQIEAPAPAQFDALVTGAESHNDQRAVDLGACEELAAPAGSKLAFRAYAKGVQIYRWTGSSWGFVGPSAVMSADAEGKSVVGTHYSGPTWESASGGKLVATAVKPCTPDANAIPWLLLGVVSNEGPGVFQRTTHILRVNTVGGKAPSNPGSVTGEEARVPYAAEYLFFRAP